MNRYKPGQTVRNRVTCYTVNDQGERVLTNPTSITFKHRNPTGTVTTVTQVGGPILNPSTGVFTYDFVPTVEGVWLTRWEAAGVITHTQERGFIVEESVFV